MDIATVNITAVPASIHSHIEGSTRSHSHEIIITFKASECAAHLCVLKFHARMKNIIPPPYPAFCHGLSFPEKMV